MSVYNYKLYVRLKLQIVCQVRITNLSLEMTVQEVIVTEGLCAAKKECFVMCNTVQSGIRTDVLGKHTPFIFRFCCP